jgi:hypothetical protein
VLFASLGWLPSHPTDVVQYNSLLSQRASTGSKVNELMMPRTRVHPSLTSCTMLRYPIGLPYKAFRRLLHQYAHAGSASWHGNRGTGIQLCEQNLTNALSGRCPQLPPACFNFVDPTKLDPTVWDGALHQCGTASRGQPSRLSSSGRNRRSLSRRVGEGKRDWGGGTSSPMALELVVHESA